MTLGRPSVLTLVGLTGLSALLFASLVSYVPSPPRNEVSQVLCGAFLTQLNELLTTWNESRCLLLPSARTCQLRRPLHWQQAQPTHAPGCQAVTRQYWDWAGYCQSICTQGWQRGSCAVPVSEAAAPFQGTPAAAHGVRMCWHFKGGPHDRPVIWTVTRISCDVQPIVCTRIPSCEWFFTHWHGMHKYRSGSRQASGETTVCPPSVAPQLLCRIKRERIVALYSSPQIDVAFMTP